MAIVWLSRATYRKMIQNLLWATGCDVVAIPLAVGALYARGVLLSPALGAVLTKWAGCIRRRSYAFVAEHERQPEYSRCTKAVEIPIVLP